MKRSSHQDAKLLKGRDLFGEVPVTRHDVFAWLLCVAGIDPASERAAAYVRGYGVVQKIIDAKTRGEFQAVADEAIESPRYRELISHGLPPGATWNPFGAGEWKVSAVSPPAKLRPMRKWRPREVIARERKRLQVEKAQRKHQDMSLLQRLPRAIPPLDALLQDIGSPSPQHLAKVMRVAPATAARWIRENRAPQSVMFALFWLTRWGASTIDAHAHNDAVQALRTAGDAKREVSLLQAELQHVEQIADFGSANDPSPRVKSMLAAQATPNRNGRLTPTTMTRSDACADSNRKKKSA